MQAKIEVLKRRFPWFLVAFITSVAISGVITKRTPHTYKSTMQLLIEPNSQGKGEASAGVENQFVKPSFEVETATQQILMQNSNLIQLMVDKLKPEYPDITVAQMKRSLVLEQIKIDNVVTKIFQVNYSDSNPIKTRKVLEAVRQVYSDNNIKQQYEKSGLSLQLVEQPQPGMLISPNLQQNLLFGAVVGMMLGGIAATLREATDDLVYTTAELEKQVDLPILGTTPKLPPAKTRESVIKLPFSKPDAPAPWTIQVPQFPPRWESLDLIYNNIELLNSVASFKSLMITSALSDDGKSDIALGLAMSAARLHKRVLLIDANLREPSLHKQLNLPNEQGLSTLLASEVTIPNQISIQSSGTSNIDILTGGPTPADPANFLSSPRMQQLMASFEKNYDLVLVDSAPVLGLVDAMLTASSCRGVVMVATLGKVTRTQLTQAKEMLSRLNLLGVVAHGVSNSDNTYIHQRQPQAKKEAVPKTPFIKNSPQDNLKLFLKVTREKETAAKYLSLHNPEKAKFYYDQIVACLEKVQEGQDIHTRRSLMKSYLNIYKRIVTLCIETNDLNSAFLYAESSKNRYLVERLLKPNTPSAAIVPAGLSKEIQKANYHERQALNLYTYEISQNTDVRAIAKSRDEWSKAKKTLEELYNQVSEIEPEFIAHSKDDSIVFTEIQSLLPLDTAILEFFLTETVLISMLVLPGEKQPIISEKLSVQLKQTSLEDIAKDWMLELTAKTTYKDKEEIKEEIKKIIQDLPTKVDQISQCLNFKILLDLIPPNIKHLIIVPHNYLHLFPIHALRGNGNQRLIDRCSVSYFPCIKVWKICQKYQRERKSLLAIENPTQDKDLIFAKAEVASISQREQFVEKKLLSGQHASKTEILRAATAHHCFHFSGHAEYNFQNPLDSYLMLSSDSNDENLTLNTITDMQMKQTDLVTLSACCTGVVDAFQPTDEYLGLPTGFLLAGAKAVVSSLWKVNSIATAFLLDEFYQQLERTDNKAVALQQAQIWLRGCTVEALIERANTWNLSTLEPKERSRLKWTLQSYKNPFPFENPYYWAAFILTGC